MSKDPKTTTLTFEQSALQPVLQALQGAIEKRTTIPILANVRLEANGLGVDFTGTDLDIDLRASCGCTVEGHLGGATTLNAGLLHDIVRKMADGAQIRLEWSDDGGQATLRSGRSRFQLQTLPASDFPDIAVGEMPHHFALPAKTLARLLDKTTFAMSTEETRYYLCGIYMHEKDGQLFAVSTDGHRLARASMPLPEGAAGMPGVIVPRKTVGELAKLLKASKADSIAVALSAAKIRFEAGAVTLTSKLIDGTFPDYERVIPARNDKRATFDRDDFAKAADRVATISSEKSRAVKISLADGSVSLSVRSSDAGEAEETLTVDYDGAPLELGLNSRYLADVLAVLDGDTVNLALGDAGSPTLFTTPADEAFLAVLMPMRV